MTIAIAETNQCFVKQTQAARKKNNDDKYEFIWSLVFAWSFKACVSFYIFHDFLWLTWSLVSRRSLSPNFPRKAWELAREWLSMASRVQVWPTWERDRILFDIFSFI